MHEDVMTMINKLKTMRLSELQIRYAEVFGEGTRCHHRDHLIKRIAWRVQALREGGLSERARQRAKELANEADLRLRAPTTRVGGPRAERAGEADAGGGEQVSLRLAPQANPGPRTSPTLTPGTMLQRRYKGRLVVVRVLADGFEHEGERYRSLTAVAQKVTGSHWSGNHFFGVGSDSAAKTGVTA